MVCRRVEVLELDTENLKVSARGYGERPGTHMGLLCDPYMLRGRWWWKVVDRYLDHAGGDEHP